MKVVIIGKGEMLANLIRGAMLADVDIAGVFRYDRLLYSPLRLWINDFFRSSPELTLMKKHKIYDIKCRSVNSEDFKREILKLNVDVMLVGTWREKFKPEIINLPVIGTINVHPSLLPKYRGPNPYLQAIWHGEKKSGVTFHLMSERFDAGPILAQGEVEILDGDTSKELKNKTVFRARLICAELLHKLKTGFIVPIQQDESRATYYSNIKPEEMTLDFTNETAEEIHSHARAFHPFMPVYIQDKSKFYVVNPYRVYVTDKFAPCGEFLEKNIRRGIVEVGAKDNKALRFEGLKVYKRFRIF